MTIKAILFDLDDTLLWDERSVQEAFEATCIAATQYVSVDPDALHQAVRQESRELYSSYETFPFTQMIGINPFEALWANFSEGSHPMFRKLQQLAPSYRLEAWNKGLKRFGIDSLPLAADCANRFALERRARPFVYEETFEVLDQLKANYHLLLLTNGSPDLQKEKIASFPKLASYFEHIVISGEFGEGKPSPNLFNYACSLLDIKPHEGIMIGDKLTTDILGSNQIGMTNIWVNHHRMQHDSQIQPSNEVSRLKEIISIIEQVR